MTVEQAEGSVRDAVIIGAGFAGICLGKRLLDIGIDNFRIVDKAARPGGTWHWNRYPGAACDVQSHFYCFSFAPNPDWSRKYSPWDEIQAYAERCVDKYGLRPHLEPGREVKLARFDDASGLCEVTCADGGMLRTRHVIGGSGGLHVPSMPRFAGAESFAGASWHSSQWRHDVDLAGLATTADLAALAARVVALEGGPAEPPPDPEAVPTPPPPTTEPAFMSRPARTPFIINGGTDVLWRTSASAAAA